MERIEGEQRLLAAQMKSSIDNLANTLYALQADIRSLVSRTSDLSSLQGGYESNKASLDEVKGSVAALNSRLEDWFDDFEQRSQHRWDKFERQRDEWRREHEAENEGDKRELEKEIRSVRETVIRGLGFGTAIGALASVVVGGFLWNVNYRFNEGREAIQDVRSTTSRNAASIQQLKDDTTDLKLYLSRGGRIPAEPYVPPAQRSNDERKP